MSNFITLTEFRPAARTTHPVRVNLANVTYMFPQEMKLLKRESYNNITNKYDIIMPEETRSLVCICFAAGLHEEADSIFVTEPWESFL